MKILIYGINFSPELTGIGKYSGELASWLAAQGHQVKVVTAPPYYPDWAVGDGYSGSWWQREVWQRVLVWRCPLWVPFRPGGVKRLLHLLSFALSSFPVVFTQLFWRPDVIWVVQPPLFCAPTAWIFSRLAGCKSWLHIQDYEVDAAFDMGLLKGKWLQRMVKAWERWLMRRFDVVSTISNAMVARAKAKGVEAERVMLVPNWVDLSGFAPAATETGPSLVRSASAYREQLGIPEDAVVALYSGNMGAKQGLEVLAGAALACNQSDAERSVRSGNGSCALADGGSFKCVGGDIYFVFCGNGVGREKLVEACSGLSNVRFMDLQPVERLAELLIMADIHLLPQRADAADLVMPSKLTGMLASGRPVVATAHPGTEIAQVVEGKGVVVPPESPKAMALAIQALAEDAIWRVQLGAAGRAYAEQHLEKEAVLKKFEALLAKFVNPADMSLR